MWVVMVALGIGLLWAYFKTPIMIAKFWLIRFCGAAFMAGGWELARAGDWAASTIRALLGGITGGIDWVSNAIVGGGIVWLIAVALTLLWIGALLPDTWFSYDPPDWLLYAGLIIPTIIAGVPGNIGEVLRVLVNAVASFLTAGVAGAI